MQYKFSCICLSYTYNKVHLFNQSEVFASKKPINVSMSLNCFSCNKEVHINKQVKCDDCNEIFHPECTNLSRTEIGLLRSQDRTLKFSCVQCKNLPSLVKLIRDLKETVTTLSNEVNQLKQNKSENHKESILIQSVISEITEREKCASNIMIYNCEEEQNVSDSTKVSNMLNACNKNIITSNINIVRLGKISAGKIRPIKIHLKSKEDALNLFKNRKKINEDFGVKISLDQTLNQRNYFKYILEAINNRKANGENVLLKFYNNVPTIKVIKE